MWPDVDDLTVSPRSNVGLDDRQASGLGTLILLANDEPQENARRSRPGRRQSARNESSAQGFSIPKLWVDLRLRTAHDHMLRNSLFLMLNSALQASLGFAFWIITARLFSAVDVGRASSLISATTVIAYLSLLGLNSTFGRYLPTADDKGAVITAGLLGVSLCGAIVGLGYVFLTPVLAPRIDFVAKHPWLTVAFIFLTAAAAVNLLTDSVFVASRRAGITALVDGGIGGIGKVVAALALVGTGAWGLYCASAIGIALSAISSVILIAVALHFRPSFRNPLTTLRPWLRFSGANYLGNLLYLLPTLIVPLIVLDRLGAAAAAYYYIAFQVASIIFSAALAVEQTFLAEGSRHNVNMRELRRRSGLILTVLCLPACLFLLVAGRWLLLAFGLRYYHNAGTSLILLTLAAGPVAMNNWLLTLLRLSGRLRAIVLSNLVYAATICGCAWIGASHGVPGVAAAWPIGACFGAGVARVFAPRNARPRHRRAQLAMKGKEGARRTSRRGQPSLRATHTRVESRRQVK